MSIFKIIKDTDGIIEIYLDGVLVWMALSQAEVDRYIRGYRDAHGWSEDDYEIEEKP